MKPHIILDITIFWGSKKCARQTFCCRTQFPTRRQQIEEILGNGSPDLILNGCPYVLRWQKTEPFFAFAGQTIIPWALEMTYHFSFSKRMSGAQVKENVDHLFGEARLIRSIHSETE